MLIIAAHLESVPSEEQIADGVHNLQLDYAAGDGGEHDGVRTARRSLH